MSKLSPKPKLFSERPPDSSENAEKLALSSETRLRIGKLVDHPWYEGVQKIATYVSVLAEPIYRGTCGISGHPTDENVADFLRIAPLPLFAANFGLKLGTRGIQHMKTPEGWIDPISIAAEAGAGIPGLNLRIARLAKGMKGARQASKFMRVSQAATGAVSLEDKSMAEVGNVHGWAMMTTLGSIPLVAKFKNLDYSNPVDLATELVFDAVMIGVAKYLNWGVRRVINKNYTQSLNNSRERVNQMIDENPELGFLREKFLYFDNKAAQKLQEKLGVKEQALRRLVAKINQHRGGSVSPDIIWQKWAKKHGVEGRYADHAEMIDKVSKDEILVIVEGLLDSMISMKDLINPVGEDLELNEKGEIKTKEIDAVVMVTDLRNFTPLTTSEKIRGNVFGFLKLNYFAYLKHSIKENGGKILNHTGDGLVIYFTDKDGRPKEEAAIVCAREINELTNLMDKIWHEQGVAEPEDNHQTGIGISAGTIRIGDVLTLTNERKRLSDPDAAPASTSLGNILEVQQAFEIEAQRICDWIDVVNDEHRQGGISRLVGMGEPINVAARLESISKAFPDHTAFIRESQFRQLSDDLMLEYEALKEVQLKGVNEVEMIYGLPRYPKQG